MPDKAKDEAEQPRNSEESKAGNDLPTSNDLGPDVLKEIEEEEPDLLKPLPSKQKERLGYLLAAKFHRGPLPPPEDIAAYDKYIPDGADRIMRMAEKALEFKINAGEEAIKQSGCGQIFGLAIGIFGIATGAILAGLGHEVVGGIIAGSTVVSIATAFITGRRRQRTSNSQ
jgi:uncharacterized membrane protein